MSCGCTHESCRNTDVIVPLEEAERFAKDCLQVIDVPEKQAELIAKALVDNDYQGLHVEGLVNIEKYVDDIRSGVLEISSPPKILKRTCATAWVDGCNCLGIVVGHYCMNLAIRMARKVGIGWVVCKGSNDYLKGTSYVTRATKEGFIGVSFSNSSPIMAPRGGKQAVLGSNPVAFAAPPYGEGFFLDMGCTASNKSKVEELAASNEPIPNGWALDETGKMTHDPQKIKTLVPLGWPNFNYKGFGIALMVETLTGILAGDDYGPNLAQTEGGRLPNLSQCFIAIDPNCFAPCFPCRMSDLATQIKHSEKVDDESLIFLPGDVQVFHMKKVDEEGGIKFTKRTMENFLKLAQKLAVSPLKALPPAKNPLKLNNLSATSKLNNVSATSNG